METKLWCTAIPATLIVLLSYKGVWSQQSSTVGDIRLIEYGGGDLEGYYEVHILYSDGQNGTSYGGVCGDNSFNTEAKVICNQLGYQYKGFHTRQLTSPVWFTHIDCDDGDTSHILRCKTTVATETQRNTCSPNNYRLLVNCDFNSPLAPYDGQVALCPVDRSSDTVTIYSTSYGLVGIYYTESKARKGINQKDIHPLGGNEADTICRNLGFTGAYPGSAVTRSVDNYNFTHCFSNTGNKPPYRFEHGSWLTTDDINCNDGNQKCIGCCMTYPHRGMCLDCDDQYNIVIRCAFDQSKITPGDVVADRSKDCKLDNNNNVVQCVQGTSQEDIIIALGSVSGILAIAICVLFIIILCLCCCKEKLRQCMERCRCRLIGECCKCKQRHRDYQQIHEQQGANITNVLESNVQMQHECINTEHAYNIIPI